MYVCVCVLLHCYTRSMSSCLVCTCSLKIYRKRKFGRFGHFHNDKDVVCKRVSMDDDIANASEEIETSTNLDTEKLDIMQVKLVS